MHYNIYIFLILMDSFMTLPPPPFPYSRHYEIYKNNHHLLPMLPKILSKTWVKKK